MTQFTTLVDGLDFGEGPRWHDGRLWYSDFYQHTVYAVTPDGEREAVVEVAGQPSGLGWLPDGRLLIVSMTDQRLLAYDGNDLVAHADLSTVASGWCNDMVVDDVGRAYVGNFGFDLMAGEAPRTTQLAIVEPDGTVRAGPGDLGFPNGSVITDDGGTLIVGESFTGRYTAFTITDDGDLVDRRIWADVSGHAPDGCALDAEGAIWFADAQGQRLVRVHEGGHVSASVETPAPVFACMLGGDDRRTLYALTAPDAHPDNAAGAAAGAILAMPVDVGGAGRP